VAGDNTMVIGPDEIELVGSWALEQGQVIEDETCRRIRSAIEVELQQVATSRDGWAKLFRSRGDDRFWELTYPCGETQGGGPPTLRVVDPKDVEKDFGVALEV
jgi:Immunity protein 27